MNPDWQYGGGSNNPSTAEHVQIDPNDPDRKPVENYKLLISGIIPRPIGFTSTVSANGKSTNLAPFSYFQTINNDPPIFILGFAGGIDNAKDTLRNLLDTKECVLNIIGEDFIEAANACAIDLPYGQSEWSVTGLTPADTTHVKPKRIKESVFSIEAKLLSTQEFDSRRNEGEKTGTLAIVEGVNFWVREDAINAERTLIDPAVLKPVARLGGISYARITDAFEIPRPVLKEEIKKGKLDSGQIQPKVNGQ
jgi:flavin reductase (DIM6/NTAB) family NADH-FMN oxidoreductase RutF